MFVDSKQIHTVRLLKSLIVVLLFHSGWRFVGALELKMKYLLLIYFRYEGAYMNR